MKFCFVSLIVFMAGCSGGVGTSLDDLVRECELLGVSDEKMEEVGNGMIFIASTGVPRLVWEGTSRELCMNGSTCAGLFPDGPPPDCSSSCIRCIEAQWSYGCERAGELCSGP